MPLANVGPSPATLDRFVKALEESTFISPRLLPQASVEPSPFVASVVLYFCLLEVHHRRPRQPVLPPPVELQIMPLRDLDTVVRQ
jgi:hypothetical protein